MYFHKSLSPTHFNDQNILNHLSDVVTVVDCDHKLIGSNLPDTEDLVNQKASIYQFIEPEFHELVKQKINFSIQNRKPTDYEVKGASNKYYDEVIWYATRVSPLIVENEVKAIILHSNDIIDLKQFEEELSKTKVHLQAMVEAVPDMIVILNKDGLVLDYKAPADPYFEIPNLTRIKGKYVETLLPKDLALQTLQKVRECLDKKQTTILEHTNPSLLNRYRSFEGRISRVDENEALVIVRDTSRTKKMQKEILDVSGRTQRRIGQDLHDSLSQQLTGIAMMTKVLEKKLNDQESDFAADAGLIVKLVNECIDQAHNLSRGLHPVELERNGFIAAIKELMLLSEKLYQIKCSCTCTEDSDIHDLSKATHVYRIVQEAITNAAKHSGCDKITTDVSKNDNLVIVTITDNGKGFDMNNLSDPGLGLNIMKYRASMVGARVSVDSQPASGTQITIQIPQ